VSYLHLFYHDHIPSVCGLHAFSLSPFRICDSLSTAIISRPCLNFPLTHGLLAYAHSANLLLVEALSPDLYRAYWPSNPNV
jgi:hypothetical protein